MSLGQCILGKRLDGVTSVSFANEYWQLTPETAASPRFAILNRFLEEPATVVPLFFRAKNIDSQDYSRLPFYVVHEEDGWLIRSEMRLADGCVQIGDKLLEIGGHPPRSSTELARIFSDHDFQASVVPKILPLIVQLRQLGVTYLTDPPYLSAAAKFAGLLGIEQQPMLSVRIDLTKALEGKIWRSLLRDFHSKYSQRLTYGWDEEHSQPLNKLISYWQHHPTLIFLWVMGGEPLLDRIVEATSLNITMRG